MERVDVLIPHFDDPVGLERSVNSVRAQTYRGSHRLVVVDDGSTTVSVQAVRELLEASGLEYHLEQNRKNSGRPYCRSRLLCLASSPFVAWLDTGDVWHPDKTEAQMETLKSMSAAEDQRRVWVTCDYDWHWDDGRSTVEVQDTEGDQLRSLMEGKQLRAYLWTLLAPREAMTDLGEFDPSLPRLQDLDFFLRFVSSGGRLTKPTSPTPRPLCAYFKTDRGKSARQIYDCNTYLLRKHAKLYERYGRRFVTRRRLQAYMLALRFAKNNGDHWLATRLTVGALLLDPFAALRFLGRKLKERG